jgi:hypothetical protein
VTFIVVFNERLPDVKVSDLKGILLSSGIAREGTDDFTFNVFRAHRVQLVGQTLNNWIACGWVSSWQSEPPLLKVE